MTTTPHQVADPVPEGAPLEESLSYLALVSPRSRGRKLAQRADSKVLQARSASLERAFSDTKRQSADGGLVPRPCTLGRFLAGRLADVGVKHWFGVPGDFNLALLDELLGERRLKMISCCNELNAGYAADGYGRANGIACLVATFSVGGLSAINAVAGAYSENVPVVVVVGAPPTTAWNSNRVVHHTLGHGGDLNFELECYRQVTCYQCVLRDAESAYDQINRAILAACEHRKPVYISVPANLATLAHPAFAQEPAPLVIPPPVSAAANLETAVSRAAAFLNKAIKPVLVCGAHMRSARARSAMIALAEASGYPVAVMVNSKGLFPEDHPNYIGLFWASISTPYTGEVVVSSDAHLFAGPIFNDLSTAGFSLMIDPAATIDVGPDTVTVGTAGFFGQVQLEDFLEALIPKVRRNSALLDKYRTMYIPPGVPPQLPPGTPLLLNRVYKQIQVTLSSSHTIVVDAGDSWFNAVKLRLPPGAGWEIQSQYASIGWSLGATLGYTLGAPTKRVVNIIGDGAFQMTAQELSTIIRYRLSPIIMIMNNASYGIEVEIHDGPYNELNSWDYKSLALALDNGGGRVHAVQVRTEEECAAAMQAAQGMQDKAVVIECVLDKDDCSVELLQLGKTLQNSNKKA
ncbi:hypothetical protein CHLNCDRAFT_35601 [Chlorella variabilis]|uniref:pyruvate decarboxylase n=1 Tax=Chlorella variabilis TaxID=554065 RepID=E1ZFT1_CHLVA|nr:hypothetical protein CHLNCDRAFT_35601 [Chlorella variabilis]EFN55335.1 hypothetical protein CHLNCDRAFT_35601 [Chlorella variabilis]|eukprot:XP_005847437.1 hypothetical protein CHLNCDRAFT_35601 [Chlorella variabilis]